MNHSARRPDEYVAFTTPTSTSAPEDTQPPRTNHGARHHWLMWLMCLPMVLLVGVLIATGRLGLGGLIYAAGCLLMMGLMMAWMNHGNNQPKH
ncbi:hypothetical protein [Nostocoides vanveenii]|uniref:Uncharacterized protein n=1 Tax=Nostocoides vanveenii TaxID=330835 RepID=A0ABP4XDJ4_9MICO